jgi:copper transport protein
MKSSLRTKLAASEALPHRVLVDARLLRRRGPVAGLEFRNAERDLLLTPAKLAKIVGVRRRAVHQGATRPDATTAEQHHHRAGERADDHRCDHETLDDATYYSIVVDVRSRRFPRASSAIAASVALVAALAAVNPETASAHAFLVRSDPEAGARLERSPRALLLSFSEPFVTASERITLRQADGERIAVTAPSRRGTVVRQALPAGLTGVVIVNWSVLSDDGHPALGEFAFAVGSDDVLPDLTAPPAQRTPWGETAAVWLFFAGLALALGGLVSELFIWKRVELGGLELVGAPVALGLLIAANGAFLHLVLLAADRAGGLSRLGGPTDLAQALDTRAGRLTLTILVLVASAAAAARWRPARPLAIVVLSAAALASAARGHSGSSGHVWAVPADAIHVAAAAIWVGALVHLVRVLYGAHGRDALEALGRGIHGYATLALVTVVVAVAGGLLTALAQFGSVDQLLETGYGRTLVVKAALIAVALAVALGARTRALAFGWRKGVFGRLSAFGLASGSVAAGLFAALVGPSPLRVVATLLFVAPLLYAALALRRALRPGRAAQRPGALLATAAVAFLISLYASGVAATAALTRAESSNDGAIAVVRLAAAAAAFALALAALLRYLPENGALRAGLLRRLASAETGALVAALAAAALLVNLAPPRAALALAARTSLGPPPLSGPAVRLADFTGQVAVGLAATERELRFDIVVPSERPVEGLRLTAEAKPPGRLSADLYPRRCGANCFTIRHRLARGETTVTAKVEVPGFEGGEARFVVPWPPRADRADLLQRVTRTMLAIPELELTELVVSGSSSARTPGRYRLSGKRLLRTAEMYRGGAVDVRILSRAGGLTQLAFALPASNIWYRMWIDESYRVTREVIVNRGHRITRSFEYPPA